MWAVATNSLATSWFDDTSSAVPSVVFHNAVIVGLVYIVYIMFRRQHRHSVSKTLHQQNSPVLNWTCRLIKVGLYNGRKMVDAVVVAVYVFIDLRKADKSRIVVLISQGRTDTAGGRSGSGTERRRDLADRAPAPPSSCSRTASSRCHGN